MRGHRPELADIQRDQNGNRRMWLLSESQIESLRHWRRQIKRSAGRTIRAARSQPMTRIWPLILVTVITSVAYTSWRMPPKADPNYLEARHIVEQYELGKSWEMLDYNHPIYSRALELLSEVDPGSVSVHESRRFVSQLNGSIKEFKQRKQADRERVEARRREAATRDTLLERAQRVTSGVDKAAAFAHSCDGEVEAFERRQEVFSRD